MEDYNTGKDAAQKQSQLLSNMEFVKSKILMSSQQLITLAHQDQKLYRRINELNHKGVESINAQKYDHALLYLEECQRTLQYVASCGRTIDRALILTVLNNQACAYQRKSMTNKAADYVEAIIYNLNMFLDSAENSQLLHQLEAITKISLEYASANNFLEREYLNIKSILMKKLQLAVYLLQFSGLNSQNQQHQESLKNAKKALLTMKQFMKLCYQYQSLIPNFCTTMGTYLIKQLSQLPQCFYWDEHKKYAAQLQTLMTQLINKRMPQVTQQTQKNIKEINLTTFFIIEPKQIPQNNCNLADSSINNFNIQMCSSNSFYLRTVLFFSATYFAISAELQQIINMDHQFSNCIYLSISNNHKKVNKQQQKIEGELFHMMSLIIGYKFIPFSTFFMQYLLDLFKQSYYHETLVPPSQQQTIVDLKMDSLKKKYSHLMSEETNFKNPIQYCEENKENNLLNYLFSSNHNYRDDFRNNFISELPSSDSIVLKNSIPFNRSGQYSDLKTEYQKQKIDKFHTNSNGVKAPNNLNNTHKIIQNQNRSAQKNKKFSDNKKQKSIKKKIKLVNLNNFYTKRQNQQQKTSKSKTPFVESKKQPFFSKNSSKTTSRFINTIHSQSDRSLKSKSKSKENKIMNCFQECNKTKKYSKTIKNLGGEGRGERLNIASPKIKNKADNNITQSIKMNKVKSPALKKLLRDIPEEKVDHTRQQKNIVTKSKLKVNINKSQSNTKSGGNWRSKSTNKSKSISGKKILSKNKLSKERIRPSIYQTVQRP